MNLHMVVQIPQKFEGLFTDQTGKYLHVDVSVHVCIAIASRKYTSAVVLVGDKKHSHSSRHKFVRLNVKQMQ